jgi:hypothetical protein
MARAPDRLQFQALVLTAAKLRILLSQCQLVTAVLITEFKQCRCSQFPGSGTRFACILG